MIRSRTACLITAAVLSYTTLSHALSTDVVKQVYIQKYGSTISREEWDSRGKSGQIVTTLTSGVTVSQTYSRGILNGKSTYTFPHSSNIEKTEVYDKGQLIETTLHFSSGIPKQAEKTLSPTIKEITFWYEDGTPKSIEQFDQQRLIKGEYFNLKHEVESQIEESNGIRTRRDHLGNFLSSDTIENGFLKFRTLYYPNGEPESITPYVNGKIQGIRKTFYLGGEPKSIEQWTNGQRNGLTTLFENGERVREIPYIADKKDGIERQYCNGNQLVKEVSWKGDYQHGLTKSYHEGVTQMQWYLIGQPVSDPKLYPKQ